MRRGEVRMHVKLTQGYDTRHIKVRGTRNEGIVSVMVVQHQEFT